MPRTAIIIGAGPAGLTAAYELLKRTDIKPVILEKSGDIGGISKTINYKGNRMDIGGHRFFSKSDRVMKWWLNIMPIKALEDNYTTITYQRKHRTLKQDETHLHANADDKKVMLIRRRLSRIYFLRIFFNYPIQLSIDTLRKLGLIRTIRILLSYLYAQLVPRKPEASLEDFMINRFGRELYLLFFKDYTEKVWGVPCNEISAEWGAQRIKGVSISKAIQHAAQMVFKKKKNTGDISQKDTETSLIEQFLYPALGPGQLWEEVARQIEILGGTILMHQDVKEILIEDGNVTGVVAANSQTGETFRHEGQYLFSTMPVQELIAGMNGSVPADVKEIAEGLQYRDFITVGVLLEPPSAGEMKSGELKPFDLKDTWIYIQEKDVKVGRLQLFNNWSPYMVNKPGNFWIGMEYFCNKGDDFWSLTDEEIKRNAIEELEKMGLASVDNVLDSTVQRVEKTYPAYFGTYNQFDKIRAFVDRFENLFLVGRNGMHKYNNADHSMLTAMTAVDNIIDGITSKENIWAINTEQEYHEEKATMEKQSTNHESKTAVELAILAGSKQDSFWQFLLKTKTNRLYLVIAAALAVIQFSIFKYFYPFPSFINGDSYVYLKMAMLNSTIDTYPIGYPMFLRLFSVFSNSDTLLVASQYLLLQCSSILFVFTIFYFFKLSRIAKSLLFFFSIANPALLYLANCVISDALFISLSIIWFTLIIWIIEKPSLKLIFCQVLVLYLAFIVRNNALYYPLIATIALLLSKQRIAFKVVGIVGSFLVIGLFVNHMSQKYYRLNGIKQFSPFSGWQLANNALYGYRYVDSADRKPVPAKFKALDAMVRNYFDTTRNVLKYPHELLLANTYYMWNKPSPLQQYVYRRDKIDTNHIPVKNWASVGPLYYSYGSFLIKKYPSQFLRGYLLPNMAKFYAPPVEFLENYNMGKDTVHAIAIKYFGYPTKNVRTRTKDMTIDMLNLNPIITGCLNALFVISFLFFAMLKGFSNSKQLSRLLWMTFFFWIVNFGFSVFAAPVGLRFQIFPTLAILASTVTMIEYISIAAFKPLLIEPGMFINEKNLSVTN